MRAGFRPGSPAQGHRRVLPSSHPAGAPTAPRGPLSAGRAATGSPCRRGSGACPLWGPNSCVLVSGRGPLRRPQEDQHSQGWLGAGSQPPSVTQRSQPSPPWYLVSGDGCSAASFLPCPSTSRPPGASPQRPWPSPRPTTPAPPWLGWSPGLQGQLWWAPRPRAMSTLHQHPQGQAGRAPTPHGRHLPQTLRCADPPIKPLRLHPAPGEDRASPPLPLTISTLALRGPSYTVPRGLLRPVLACPFPPGISPWLPRARDRVQHRTPSPLRPGRPWGQDPGQKSRWCGT